MRLTNSYSADIDVTTELTKPFPPEKAHHSKRITTSLGKRLDNHYAELGFKMAFHDLEDNKNGFLQGAQINIASIQVRAEENVGLRLYKFDFADVLSLTPRNKFFTPVSWKIYSGFERELTNNKDQLVYHLTAGMGGTWEYIKNHQFYTLATSRIEINKQMKNALEPAIGFSSGLLSHFKYTTAHLKISGEHFQDDIYRLRAEYLQNFVFSTNHSLKISAKHQWQNNNKEFSDINLAYQYYF